MADEIDRELEKLYAEALGEEDQPPERKSSLPGRARRKPATGGSVPARPSKPMASQARVKALPVRRRSSDEPATGSAARVSVRPAPSSANVRAQSPARPAPKPVAPPSTPPRKMNIPNDATALGVIEPPIGPDAGDDSTVAMAGLDAAYLARHRASLAGPTTSEDMDAVDLEDATIARPTMEPALIERAKEAARRRSIVSRPAIAVPPPEQDAALSHGSIPAGPVRAVSANSDMASQPPPRASKSMPPTSGAKPSEVRRSIAASLDPEMSAVDHRGRAQPLYKRKSKSTSRPSPRAWRPHWTLNLLLGLIPGARWMASGQAARGIAFAAAALFVLFPGVMVVVGWTSARASMRALLIDDKWLLLHGAVALASIATFEMLRTVSSVVDSRRAIGTARIVAGMFLPSILVLAGGPQVVRFSPTALEALWFISLIATLGGLLAAMMAAAGNLRPQASPSRRFLIAGGAGLLIVLVVFAVTVNQATLKALAASAQGAGFEVLPKILGAVAGS